MNQMSKRKKRLKRKKMLNQHDHLKRRRRFARGITQDERHIKMKKTLDSNKENVKTLNVKSV